MYNVYDYEGNSVLGIDYSTPEQYGAVGDDTSDDTIAIQNAVNSKDIVLFGSSKIYKVTNTIRLHKGSKIFLNGATIHCTVRHVFFNFLSTDTFTGYNGNGEIIIQDGTLINGAISLAHGINIVLKNLKLKNCINDHFLEIVGCKDFLIDNCSFVGNNGDGPSVLEYINVDPCVYNAFPALPRESAFYDGTKNDGIEIINSYFSLGDSPYNYGYNAFGVHGVAGQSVKHRNIKLIDNTLRGFTGCGFRINDMENVVISGNDINVTGDGIRVGDVGQSTDVIIKGNVIIASGTAITKDNSSTVFQAADNDINPTFS